MQVKKSDDVLFWPIVIAICFAAYCAFASPRAYSQEPTNRKPYESLVELRDSQGQGTGTLIYKFPYGAGVVLTARHVALQPGHSLQANWIWSGKGKTQAHTFSVMAGNHFDSDMALVAVEVPAGIEPIKVVPFNPNDGPFIAAGYRDGLLRVNGPLYDIQHTQDGKIIINEPYIPGQSGGFVCNRYGQVVGIIVASDLKSVGVASDGDNLKRLLKDTVPPQ